MSTWLLERALKDVLKIVLYMHETQNEYNNQCMFLSPLNSQNRNTRSSTAHFILLRVMVNIKALVLAES